jgi:hypothetical protein
MNSIKQLGMLMLAFAAIFMFSCNPENEEPENETPTPNQEEYIQCKIDGVDFLSKDDEEDLFSYARINFGQHHLKGADETTQSINLWFWQFDGVGTYPIGGENNVSCQWLTVNPNATYDCNETLTGEGKTSGQIEVTASDENWIEGTFEFTAVNTTDHSDQVVVTDGKFKLKYK